MSGWDWINGLAFVAFVMWRIGMIHPEQLTLDTIMNPTPQDAAQEEVITGDLDNDGGIAGDDSNEPATNATTPRPVIDIRRP